MLFDYSLRSNGLLSMILACVLLGPAGLTHAETGDAPQVLMKSLSNRDKDHLKRQRASVDELGREHFGQPLRQTTEDLDLVQRLIYKGAIAKDDRLQLQALGVIMGDAFVRDLDLEWRIYEDKLGRSRATCVKGKEECLFPITMLSRRMEVGLIPNVQMVYNKAKSLIEPHLPKKPYSDVKKRVRPI